MDLDFERDPAVLASLIDELEEGVFTLGLDGRIVGWSRGAARISGFRRAEIEGRVCGDLDDPGGCIRTLLPWLRDRADERISFAGRIVARGGRDVPVRGFARLVRAEDGAVQGAIGVFREAAAPAPARTDAAPGGLVGSSEAMREVGRRIRLAAHSDVTVVITGESGTGKELAARAVHDLGARAAAPFVAVNCSALSESLLESELFGHVRGAFTGAIRDRPGVLETADGGTLFLDEIGEVSPLIQVKLLRVLQERELRRVGGDRLTHVDVRLITATNRDLRALVEDGRMREDFYYRIKVYEIAMPTLRDRLSDVPALVDHFVQTLGRRFGKRIRGPAAAALRCLLDYDWPGNVRELRNAIEHAFVTVEGETIEVEDLPEVVRLGASGIGMPARRADAPAGRGGWSPKEIAERAAVVEALQQHGWNRTATAEALGVSRVTLWKRMRKYRIDEGVFGRGGG
jgi:PAS domain S-box-containing protein